MQIASNRISISNIVSKTERPTKEVEQLLKGYDVTGDNTIDENEATRLYQELTGGLEPRNINEVLDLLGVERQHDVRSNTIGREGILRMGARDHRGNFKVPGLGAGHLLTERSQHVTSGGPRDVLNVLLNCDLFSLSAMDAIRDPELVIGPKDWRHEDGSDIAEAAVVPLDRAVQKGYHSYNRFGPPSHQDEKKYLAASIDLAGLRDLAGDSGGLALYVRFRDLNGRIHWVNQDGEAFKSFTVDADALAPRGDV